jgi:pimeloyl-ACP methyl ester carboxylesterase
MKSLYLRYPSSIDPELELHGRFELPDKPSPLRLHLHGFNGNVRDGHPDNIAAEISEAETEYLMVRPEMRGRGESTGRADCNGLELQDAVDAVEFAKREFPELIINPECVILSGGSGGGGNVFALLGRFPDYFARAHADCGISDYTKWFYETKSDNSVENMRSVMFGGTPKSKPNAYFRASGIHAVGNWLTPVIIFHGECDTLVPVKQSRAIVTAAQEAEKWNLVTYVELPDTGDRDHWSGITPEIKQFRARLASSFLELPMVRPVLPRKGTLVVQGYLRTKKFDVLLKNIDATGYLIYDLDNDKFELSGASGTIIRHKVMDKATRR